MERHSIYIIYSFTSLTKYLPTILSCLLVAQSIFHRDFSSFLPFDLIQSVLHAENSYPQSIPHTQSSSSNHHSRKEIEIEIEIETPGNMQRALHVSTLSQHQRFTMWSSTPSLSSVQNRSFNWVKAKRQI